MRDETVATPSPVAAFLSLEAARSGATVLALTLALMLPALWNGYPILYFDSVDYLTLGFTWAMPVYRTAGYGFIALAGTSTGTLWVTLFVQSLCVAFVLYESRRLLAPWLRGWTLFAVLAAMMTLTSLPWVTSEIMPDVFTAPAVLLTLLLALRGDELSLARKAVFILLLAVSCLAHPTHVAMVAGLVLCLCIGKWLRKRGWPVLPLQVRAVVAGLLLGTVLSVAANWAVTGRIFFAPRTTPVLTFAVLLEEGLGQRYLAETCNQPGLHQSVLCPYRETLPADANQFLWHTESFWKAGGWNRMMPESAKDLQEILRRYPGEFAWAATQLMAEQLVTIRTGEGFRTMVGFVDRQIRTFYPRDTAQFEGARQQHYPEVPDSPMPAINLVQVPLMLAGLLLLIGVTAIGWRRRDSFTVSTGGIVLLAYLGNAFICGAISNPADRYGSRLAWLAALAAVVLLLHLRRGDAPGTSFAAR